jgi:hypothetical protein
MISFDQLEGELSLKAIAWDFDQGKFVSPSYSGFVWERDGIESAECNKGCEDIDIPGDDCTCGLYSTFRWNIIAKGYTAKSQISPVVLVEAIGKTVLHDDGIRSYQQGIRAVINTWRGKQLEKYGGFKSIYSAGNLVSAVQASAHQASDYFQIPILDFDVATVVMDLWNIHLNAQWGHEDDDTFGYVPESETVKKMKAEEVEILSQQYLPTKPVSAPVVGEEVTWQKLLGNT